jgi:hypothetical protein
MAAYEGWAYYSGVTVEENKSKRSVKAVFELGINL